MCIFIWIQGCTDKLWAISQQTLLVSLFIMSSEGQNCLKGWSCHLETKVRKISITSHHETKLTYQTWSYEARSCFTVFRLNGWLDLILLPWSGEVFLRQILYFSLKVCGLDRRVLFIKWIHCLLQYQNVLVLTNYEFSIDNHHSAYLYQELHELEKLNQIICCSCTWLSVADSSNNLTGNGHNQTDEM